jgi:hypothetical protein
MMIEKPRRVSKAIASGERAPIDVPTVVLKLKMVGTA